MSEFQSLSILCLEITELQLFLLNSEETFLCDPAKCHIQCVYDDFQMLHIKFFSLCVTDITVNQLKRCINYIQRNSIKSGLLNISFL